jgi:hypothetical protein
MSTKNEIAKLTKMKVNELQAKFAEVIGEKTRSPNKTFLIRKITEELQAKAPADATSPSGSTTAKAHVKAKVPVTEKLTRLDVAELQARYLEVVGRPTGSTSKAYMVWKIREARKGRIPLGPRKNAHREGVTFKVLPLRMEAAVVDKVDEAWRSRGIKNRMEFFRGALGHYLKQLGAEDAAALFADDTVA